MQGLLAIGGKVALSVVKSMIVSLFTKKIITKLILELMLYFVIKVTKTKKDDEGLLDIIENMEKGSIGENLTQEEWNSYKDRLRKSIRGDINKN
jgi:heme/copper-type cytochrome/quinol oxidase subunit 2